MNDASEISLATLVSKKSVAFAIAVSGVYLLCSTLLIGFAGDQLVLVVLFNLMFFISWKSRKVILAFSIFIVYWVIFDYMKAYPNYQYRAVHIKSLYDAEKGFFGISEANSILTPNEYLLLHQAGWLNVLTGLFYLCWVPLPLIFAGILFFKNRRQYFCFSLTFLLVNGIGFFIYYLYPAAPPWYVREHGFVFLPHTHGNVAGLGRFDAFFRVGVFSAIYSKSSNVFAAMPSLHASYPLLVLFYGIKYKFGYWNLLFLTIMIGIWFSAIYNYHHYLIDVIAGILCGLLGIVVFWLLAEKTNTGNKVIGLMIKKVT